MNNKVNGSIQIVPVNKKEQNSHAVQTAIDVIQRSGLHHEVGAMETAVEGDYDEIMNVVKQIHETCYNDGAEELVTYLKIHSKKDKDVLMKEKVEKFRN